MGGSGSGKSTYAKKLSLEHNVSHFDLDELRWQNLNTKLYNQKRSEEERAIMLNNILNNNSDWICEGVYFKEWVHPILEQADEVLILQPKLWIRQYRCIKRSIKRMLHLEPSKHKDTLFSTYKLLRWSHDYDTKYLPIALEKMNNDKIKYRILKKW